MSSLDLPPRFAIRVAGTPIPQGSKTANRYGHGVRDANANRLKPWRQHMTAVAKDAGQYWETLTVPVAIWLTFTFARPKTHYYTGRNAHILRDNAPAYPTSHQLGDIDKLQRAVFDSLTDAEIWEDDSQVVDVRRARKFFAGEHEYASPVPGVDIVIEPLSPVPAPASTTGAGTATTQEALI